MAYDKKTRDELMNDEIMEDKIKEVDNEVDDGAMDSWIADEYENLIADFLDDYNDEWVGYCRERWAEYNE